MRRRRDVLMLLGGVAGAIAAPFATAVTQQPSRIYRIGILSLLRRPNEGALRRAMQELGYIEGWNVIYEARYAGRRERLAEAAAELVRAAPDVIVTAGGPASEAARDATRTIPIVLWGAGDPVATGLVANVAHPGGNITGVTELSTELTGKRLQLFKEAVPGLVRIAVIWNAEDRAMSMRFYEAEAASPQLGLALMPLPIHELEDFDAAFAAMAADRPDGVFVVTDLMTALREGTLIGFMLAHRLPSIFESPGSARGGGLMSYGPSLTELAPRAAAFVDRILKGAKSGDLPLEGPSRFHLLVNLRTARAIGIELPWSLLARADEVIE
jgi:putative ABC transport system substrate-binding protein